MSKVSSYKKIGTIDDFFKDANIKKLNEERKKITLDGTIKLHGACAGVSFDGNDIRYQSKDGLIEGYKGHFGFRGFMERYGKNMMKFFEYLIETYQIDIDKNIITIYGEFCGDNIQNSDIGLVNLPKCFVMFDAKVTNKVIESGEDNIKNPYKKINMKNENNKCIISDPKNNIYNIYDFPTYQIEVDLKNPQKSHEEIMELTYQVEKECPFTKSFGKSGGGEGIVWRFWEDSGLCITYKSKGNKHSVRNTEFLKARGGIVKSAQDFATAFCTKNRFDQFVTKMFTADEKVPTSKDIPILVNTIFQDAIQEEIQNSEYIDTQETFDKFAGAIRKMFFEKYPKE